MGMEKAFSLITGQMYRGKHKMMARAVRVTMLENFNVEREEGG